MYVRMRFPTYVSCLVAVAVFGFLFAASSGRDVAQGALSVPYTGVGVVRLGGGNWSTLSNTNQYSVMLASSNNASAAGAQPGRSLMYSCGTNMPPDAEAHLAASPMQTR